MNLRNLFLIHIMLYAGLSGCNTLSEDVPCEPTGFIPIPAAQFDWKGKPVSLRAFEMMDHTVTNLEYKKFIDASGYPAPLHWKNGVIPKGKEEYPVIFVNRDDAEAYTRWLTKTTGRVYRLPTTYEFTWAALGGMEDARYPWGNDEQSLTPENVNYNEGGSRRFDRWEEYLKPARWGITNGSGLYNMAGNVWQLIEENIDPETARFKYRMETLVANNRIIMGGSWYSSKENLSCGKVMAQSPGIRYPDLGIRLVREPEGTKWQVRARQLCATTNQDGKLVLSWAALHSDSKKVSFNVYRIAGDYRNQSGIKVNREPICYTSFLDTSALKAGTRYQYRVIPVDESGQESYPSEWSGVTVSDKINPVVVTFKPLFEQGTMTPVFGDLEGWGKKGCVIRLDNGNKEMSQDPGIPVQLEAFSLTGRSLWRKDIASHENIFGSANNAPFNVWDMDGDGKDEVITLLQIGDQNFVAILDGMSGRIRHQAPWTKMATDLSRSSTRIQLSTAYLNGKTPAVITQTGIYENEIITAYDHQLNKLWDFNSFKETNGSGGHKIEVADVDGDGKQEIVYGTTCLNPDGAVRWSIYRQHPDIISIHDHIPDRPGLEVLFVVESSVHAGVYMVDASSGEIIWKNNREEDPAWTHGHVGWSADIWDASPGMEVVSNRAGHGDRNFLLFSSEGKRIMEFFPAGYVPVEWDGDDTRELLGDHGKTIGKFNGEQVIPTPGCIPNPVPNTNLIFTADLVGDFRSEMVVSGTDEDGRKTIMVITATDPITPTFVSPREDLDYRLWLARNKGGGYASIYDYEFKNRGEQ